jgi:GTP cyclohydrolase II
MVSQSSGATSGGNDNKESAMAVGVASQSGGKSPRRKKISQDSAGLARLIGNRSRVAVERAIAELRAGRPVLLGSGGRDRVVVATEAVDPETLAELATRTDAALVFPEPRARHLGIEDAAGDSVALSLAGCDAGDIVTLVYGVAPDLRSHPAHPASPLESTALNLVRRTFLLPSVVVLPAGTDELSAIARVTADDVHAYDGICARDMRIVSRARVPLDDSVETEFLVFNTGDGLREQVALKVGRPDTTRPVLTRIHSACLTGDLFASLKCDCGEQLRLAVRQIAAAGGGVLLYLDQEGRSIGLSNKIRAYALQAQGFDTIDSDAILGYGADERRYDLAGRMLECLGIDKIVLLTNNPSKIESLGRLPIRVVDHQRLLGAVNPYNCNYLTTKATRAGHLLNGAAGE